eukprot:Phypoly_transcript_02099.p1 GENE.Phypoly_transcript_02099~~Phypoly_transcript_02099.p1  ORF type:complete len:934 (+),score=200.22 Phypoly_transcript_02099:155-2956(+)
MHFGSFDSDDLNSLQPAISLPVKKRQAKPAASTRPSLSSSSSDLHSSNDNVAPASFPPGHHGDPISPSSTPIHDPQPLYPPNPYDPPMQYIPYNTMHPAYMPPPYNHYMHPIPPHMGHMQPMHMPPHMYGMPQQHLGPTHPPPPHPHARPHPHSHPNQHPHHMQSNLSASSPSFTPAHLHHTTHASAQYPARTQYEYPQQQLSSQPLSPHAQHQHPQQAQEQPQPAPSPKESEQLTSSQLQPQPTPEPTQPTQLAQEQITPPQTLQQSQDPQQPQETPQPSSHVSPTHTQPQSTTHTQSQDPTQTQEPTPEHTAKPPSKHKKRGKNASQKQAQPQQSQTLTQSTSQPQSPTQPLSPKQSAPEPQQPPHTGHSDQETSHKTNQDYAQNTTHQEDTLKTTQQEDSQKTTLQEDSQNSNDPQKNATTPSPQEAPAKGSSWAKLLFTPKVSPSTSTSTSPAPPVAIAQQPNAKSNATDPSHKPKLNGHPAPNGKSSDASKSPATPLVPMSAKLLQDLSKLSMTLPALQSRGLKNPTNTCFLNVILQSLVHCPPFAHMLSKLGNVELPASQMPVTDKFVRLYKEFQLNARPIASSPAHSTQSTANGSANHADYPAISADNTQNNNTPKSKYSQSAPPLLPELFFDLLFPFSQRTGIPYKDGDKVNQQDAQEFLTYILDLMHEEFLLFHKNKEPAKTTEKSDEWEEVGKKNKSSIVLTSDTYPQSVISHMFGGKQRSSVRKQSQGSKPSVTIEPFYCLHLDIDKPRISSLEDALETYMEPEKLEGYTDDVRGVEVQASKHTSLETLPKILIIHFKRFAYDMSQPRKLDKFITFPLSLAIKENFLSKKVTSEKRMYSLYAVVEHRGKVAVKGHYTCDINIGNLHAKPTPAPGTPGKSEKSEKTPQPEKSEWLNFDDHNVARVHPKDVLNRLAYLLFYVQN